MKNLIRVGWILSSLILVGCATTPPPQNKENLTAIFKEYPRWYKAAKKTEHKWGVPVNVQMAIIYYESAFVADARPYSRCFFGLFPGQPLSSALGYAQALDSTWQDYLSTCGGFLSSRTKFESASDFIGWYSALVRDRLGIPQNDSYNLYLAYHEGMGGYSRGSYLKKPWLMSYAKKVAIKSQIFQNQLAFFEHGNEPYYNCVPTPTELPLTLEPPAELELPNYHFENSEQETGENNKIEEAY